MGKSSFQCLIRTALPLVVFITTASPTQKQLTWKRALESPLANDLVKCKENWVSISKRASPSEISSCLHKLFLSVVPRLMEPSGVSALDIPPMEPLVVPKSVPIGGGAMFGGHVDGLTVRGIAKGLNEKHSSVSFDVAESLVTVNFVFPEGLAVEASYNLTINAGALFGESDSVGTRSEGVFTATAVKPTTTVTIGMAKGTNGALKVVSSQCTVQTRSFPATFQGQDPFDPVAGLLSSIMKSPESSRQIFDELKAPIERIVAYSLGSLFHRGWKNLDEI